jgi:hypothetical protein
MCALPDTTAPSTCNEACADLYACSVLTCNGSQNCPGFSGDPSEETNFLGFCGQACANQMAVIALVDPADCDGTVQTIQAVSAEYDALCTMGGMASSSSASSSSASVASSSSTGGGACALPDTTDPATCAEACSDLYDCGALTCNGSQNCAGFDGTAMDKQAFVSLCVPSCNNQMALIAVIDPAACDTTIQTISGVSAQFADVCANGQ